MSSNTANGDVMPALRPVAAGEEASMDSATAVDSVVANSKTASAAAAATTEAPPSAVADRSADNNKQAENGQDQGGDEKQASETAATTTTAKNANDKGGEENAEAAEAEVTYPEPEFGGEGEAWPTQVYMVRVFRPDDEAMHSATKALEERISALREHIDYLRAGEKVTTVTKRNQAIERGKARERLREVGAEVRAKVAQKAPLIEQVQQHKAAMDTLRNTARDLPVRNETELDARIAELEDKMMHGTIDLRTEKQYVREIKTLQATREELKSMNEQKGALEGSKVYQEELRDTLNILSEELKVLRGQEEMLKKVFEKTREAEQSAEAELKKLYEIRTDKQSQRDALIKELNGIKNKFYTERRAHAKYRAKFHEVGKLIKADRLSDAHGAADAHNTIMNDRLNSDTTFRQEYVRLSKKRNLDRFVNIMGPWGEKQIDEKVIEALSEKKPPAKGGKGGKGASDKADDKSKAASAPASAPTPAPNNNKKSSAGAKAAPAQGKALDANSTHSRAGKKSATTEKDKAREVMESLPSSSPSEGPSASAAASTTPTSQTDKDVSAFLLKSLKGARDSETMRVIEEETKRAEAEAKEVAEKERLYREKLAQERAAEELKKKQEQEAYAREQQIKKREAAERAAAKQREREAREEALKEEKREKRKLRKEKSKVSADATAQEGGGEDERDLHPTSDTPQEIDNLRAQDEVTAETDDLVADEEEQGTKSSGSRKKHKKKPQKKNNTNVAKRKTIKPPVKRNMATFVSQTWKKHPALIAVISFSIVFTILVVLLVTSP